VSSSDHAPESGDQVILYGVPHGQDRYNSSSYDIFQRALTRNHPDLVFLQLPPENFMARQRFLSQKSALKGVEDYDPKALPSINPETPLSWEELVVNPVILDMIMENKTYEEINLRKSLLTYSYPEHSDKGDGGIALRDKYIASVTSQIIGKQFSEFNAINQALYQALLGKHKVMLGEIPETLYRQILANNLSLDQLKDIFKFCLDMSSQLSTPVSLREAAHNFLPHIFQAPKDLYMTALIKETFQAATCLVGFIGRHHIEPIQKSWIAPPHGINMTEATRIPERDIQETDQETIEKHALLDSLLEKRPWGQKYIHNPFPYLFEDITKLKDEDVAKLVQSFRFFYEKYQLFKKEAQEKHRIPDYQDRRLKLFENLNYISNPNLDKKNAEVVLNMLSKSHNQEVQRIQLKGRIFRQQLKE
jgi:hypothetical protein